MGEGQQELRAECDISGCPVCLVCIALAVPISDSVNGSLTAPVGQTLNLTCTIPSSHPPVDFYYLKDGEGASPLLLYANGIDLERRYDIRVSSSGQCPGVADSGRQHIDEPGLHSVIHTQWCSQDFEKMGRGPSK